MTQFKTTIRAPHTLAMEEQMDNYAFNLKNANVKILNKKCNKFDFTNLKESDLRRHLKRHSEEKPNKCNQCDFASSEADHLKRHSISHSGEKSDKCYQCDFAPS